MLTCSFFSASFLHCDFCLFVTSLHNEFWLVQFLFYPQAEESSKLGLIISIHRWIKSGKFHQLQQNHIVRIALSGITKMNKFAHFLGAGLDFTVFLKPYYVLPWQWIKILGKRFLPKAINSSFQSFKVTVNE